MIVGDHTGAAAAYVGLTPRTSIEHRPPCRRLVWRRARSVGRSFSSRLCRPRPSHARSTATRAIDLYRATIQYQPDLPPKAGRFRASLDDTIGLGRRAPPPPIGRSDFAVQADVPVGRTGETRSTCCHPLAQRRSPRKLSSSRAARWCDDVANSVGEAGERIREKFNLGLSGTVTTGNVIPAAGSLMDVVQEATCFALIDTKLTGDSDYATKPGAAVRRPHRSESEILSRCRDLDLDRRPAQASIRCPRGGGHGCEGDCRCCSQGG